MKIKNFNEKIEIPLDIDMKILKSTIVLKGPIGEVSKEFKMPAISFSKDGNTLVVTCKKFGMYEKEKVNSVKAHIKNMIRGCQKAYIYNLKICSSHFPMTASVSGNKFQVKNQFGEKVPRELVLKAGAKVVVKGDTVEVTGLNKEIVSQVAADIEMLTRIANKDRRVFQDGIYITSKDGHKI